jgi:hypothetical protein
MPLHSTLAENILRNHTIPPNGGQIAATLNNKAPWHDDFHLYNHDDSVYIQKIFFFFPAE